MDDRLLSPFNGDIRLHHKASAYGQKEDALDLQRLMPERQGSTLILASGGVDSSTLLWLSAKHGLNPVALFVDFGQPAAEAENNALASICEGLNVPWRCVQYVGSRFEAGEIRGRNAFLLQVGLLEFPSGSGIVALGIHAGTDYADCSPEFMQIMRQSYRLQTGGTIVAVAPFIDWTKRDVYHLAIELDVPIDKTHSCESSSVPCRQCNSCVDRHLLKTGSVSR